MRGWATRRPTAGNGSKGRPVTIRIRSPQSRWAGRPQLRRLGTRLASVARPWRTASTVVIRLGPATNKVLIAPRQTCHFPKTGIEKTESAMLERESHPSKTGSSGAPVQKREKSVLELLDGY